MRAINKLRVSQGLTIKQFAELLGFSESYIRAMFYGKRGVSVEVLRRIRKAFPNQNLGDYIDD